MMKKYILIVLCVELIFSLGSCKDDDEPDVLSGTWKLTAITFQDFNSDFDANDGMSATSFYGETSYELIFSEGTSYERSLSGISVNDQGSYTITENTLSLNRLTGDTFVGIHNIFTVIEPADETSVLLETSVTVSVYSNENQGSTDTDLLETTSAKARITFEKQ